MSLVVYGDFNCPWSYLASRRVDALASAGVDIEWRAVEHDPQLPVTGRAPDADEQIAIKNELAAVSELLLADEQLPLSEPQLIPKTEAAVAAFAEACGAGVANDVRRLLFAAYWVDGTNIGDPETLRKLLAGPLLRGRSGSVPLSEHGLAVTASGGPITTGAWRRVRDWRAAWNRLGSGVVPTLVEDGDAPITGAAALRRLAEEITRVGADLNPDLPDPARFPSIPDRPPKTWVSQVGGRWSHAWKGSGGEGASDAAA